METISKESVDRDFIAILDLRHILQDAIEGMEEMLHYVPEYFQKKWDHQGYIDRAKQCLADTESCV